MKIKKKLIMFILFVFLLSGFLMGFLIGGYTTQDKWISFYESKNKETEKYCDCNYPETDTAVFPEFNISLNWSN